MISFDTSENLYIADQGNSAMRVISPAGIVSNIGNYYDGNVDGPIANVFYQKPIGIKTYLPHKVTKVKSELLIGNKKQTNQKAMKVDAITGFIYISTFDDRIKRISWF